MCRRSLATFFLKLEDTLRMNKVFGERVVSKKAIFGSNMGRESEDLRVLEGI